MIKKNVLSIGKRFCEYLEDPLGIDVHVPRFSWIAQSDERDQTQKAYQVMVASKSENLHSNCGDLWDSGRVDSGQSVNVEYKGRTLSSCQSCYWKVRVWNQDDIVSSYSAISTFSMGLLESSEWKGEWIGFPGQDQKNSPIFRNEFRIEKKIAAATVYIAGLGYYELSLNGRKVGDHVLDPGWTDYSKRILYATYDVTDSLRKGSNVIGVMLGNGWYWNPGTIREDFIYKSHGTPKFLLQMNIQYSDGEIASIMSNSMGWSAAMGPIIENSIYHGEYYDARLEKDGWNSPGFRVNLEEWVQPVPVESPGGRLVSQMLEPIKVIMDLIPIQVTNPKPQIYVFDMGQNFAGWIKLTLSGSAGDKIIMRFSEVLNEEGTVNQENLRNAKATDIYVLRGDSLEVYEPRFTYHGFRYIQMEGLSDIASIKSVAGRVVRSSVRIAGKFNCSSALLNKLQQNILWTETSNLYSIPTDCPQRDERLGWLNDATVRAEESVYNFNMTSFYPKWLDDIKDTQDESDGSITDTVPDCAPFFWGHRHADAVCSSYIIIPWLLYLHHSDKRVLERNYCGMKRWTEFLFTKTENYIVNYSHMGDWASPAAECLTDSLGSGAYSANTPGNLISTGYLYYNVKLLAQIAEILEEKEDESRYKKLLRKIKKSFNEKFFDKSTNQYAGGSQASNVFPLFLGIVPKGKRKSVLNNVIRDVMDQHNGHLTTGNLCTKYLFEVLTDGARGDIAYLLATSETYPSWGYSILKGATTLWERWEEKTGGGMNSHNHPMYGSISAWFFKYLGGINPDLYEPGFGKMIIKPTLAGDLDYVDVSLETVRGSIASSWKKGNHSLELNITIPFNSTANLFIPDVGFISKDGCHGNRVRMDHSSLVVTESGKVIWEEDTFIEGVQGIKAAYVENDQLVFQMGSGEYSICCTHRVCH